MENTRSSANDPVNEEEFLRAQSEFWGRLNESEEGRKHVESLRVQSDYWRPLNESGGFDIENIIPPPESTYMMMTNCLLTHGFGYPKLMDLYAMLGLHRYNLLKGTNLEYGSLIKYNYPGPNAITSYYITMVVVDPVTHEEFSFQTCVKENEPNSLDLGVSIARLKDSSSSFWAAVTEISPLRTPSPLHTPPPFELPQWPSTDAFYDPKRFLLFDSSSLKIVQAAIESTTEDVDPRLNAKDVTVYITFKGVASVTSHKISEHHVRKCIIRRGFDHHTGYFILQGDFSGEVSSCPDSSLKELSQFLDRVFG